MCGICGTAGFADLHQLERMNAAILHRGPDDGGVQILPGSDGLPGIGLANRRLSIIDLSPAGHQPMSNEDGRIWLTYNGELFNFLELRPTLEQKGHIFRSHTDTEVLIHLYEERGMQFLNDLNGMFALALWDAHHQQLLLARDPFGIKPLYYLPLPSGRLAFASEIKSFLAGGLLQPEVDDEALHDYLNFLWVPGPKTLFKGVFKLMPGHYLLWKEDLWKTEQYWQGLPETVPDSRPERELLEELRTLLREAVKRHLVSDVPLGIFLSGGLDSSTLLALSTQISGRPLDAYTITFRASDSRFEQSDEDPIYARRMARFFGARHHEIEVQPSISDLLPKVIWHLDEPIADPAAITSYLICESARSQQTVLLSGQGGDEIFGGYRVHLSERLSAPLRFIPSFLREKIVLPAWDSLPAFKDKIPGVRPGKLMAYHRYFRRLLQGASLPPQQQYVFQRSYYLPGEQIQIYTPEFRSQVEQFDPYETHLRYFRQAAGADFIDQMLYVDQKTFLPELNLAYSDKTSMAASVEVRVPFLDKQVAAFMRRLPGRVKIRGMKQKYLLKKAMQGFLPEDVIWRGKAGFGAPVRTWLRNGLYGLEEDLLSEETIRKRGFFDPQVIRRMVQQHREGINDVPYHIWAFLTLECWMRIFFDGNWKDSFSFIA